MIDLVAILIIFAFWAYALVRWTRTKARVVELGISSAILAYCILFIVTGILQGYNFDLVTSDIAQTAVFYFVLISLLTVTTLFMVGGSDTFEGNEEDRSYLVRQLTHSGPTIAILVGIVLLTVRANAAERTLNPLYLSGRDQISITTEPLNLPGTTVLPILLGVWWLALALWQRWRLVGPAHSAAFLFSAALAGSAFALQEARQPLANSRIPLVLGTALAGLLLVAFALAPFWRNYRRGITVPALLQLAAIALLGSYYILILYAHIQSRPYLN